jgi:peptidoglycan-N-acetylglucosamine deacetylase
VRTVRKRTSYNLSRSSLPRSSRLKTSKILKRSYRRLKNKAKAAFLRRWGKRERKRLRLVATGILNDLYIAVILFFIVIATGVIAEIKNSSAYPTSRVSPDVYRSAVEPHTAGGKVRFDVGDKIVFNGARSRKEVALTFDADMTEEMKAQVESGEIGQSINWKVIEVLNNTNTKATFFLSGMWIEMYKDEVAQFSKNSLFELANHSYSHPSFNGECFGLRKITSEEKREEILKTQSLLREITGEVNNLFRFPGGCYSSADLDLLFALDMIPVQWDVAGRDGFNNDPLTIEDAVLSNVRPGSIIVLHMNGQPNSPVTAEALPYIIRTLKQNGYEFVTVTELLQRKSAELAKINWLSTLLR